MGLHEQLDDLLGPLIRDAVMLTPVRSIAAQAAAADCKFGGLPYATQGEHWPVCSTCRG